MWFGVLVFMIEVDCMRVSSDLVSQQALKCVYDIHILTFSHRFERIYTISSIFCSAYVCLLVVVVRRTQTVSRWPLNQAFQVVCI